MESCWNEIKNAALSSFSKSAACFTSLLIPWAKPCRRGTARSLSGAFPSANFHLLNQGSLGRVLCRISWSGLKVEGAPVHALCRWLITAASSLGSPQAAGTWELKTTIHLHHPFVFQGILSLAVRGVKKICPAPSSLPAWGNVCVCANPSDSDAELKWGRQVPWRAILQQAGQLLGCGFTIASSHYKAVLACPHARCALWLQMPGHTGTPPPNIFLRPSPCCLEFALVS